MFLSQRQSSSGINLTFYKTSELRKGTLSGRGPTKVEPQGQEVNMLKSQTMDTAGTAAFLSSNTLTKLIHLNLVLLRHLCLLQHRMFVPTYFTAIKLW